MKTNMKHHIMRLNHIEPTEKRILSIRTTAGERLPDMGITADDGYQTGSLPSYWSLFLAADYAAKALGRSDLWIAFRETD